MNQTITDILKSSQFTRPESISSSREIHWFSADAMQRDFFRKGFMSYDYLDEPTYFTFFIDFDFEGAMVNPITGFTASPLFCIDPNEQNAMGQSAYSYLKRNYDMTDVTKPEKLIEFMTILKYISRTTPWYFQSITGLNKLWSAMNRGISTGHRGEVKLMIESYEAIDLRLARMAHAYRTATLDGRYLRETLPENLRKFHMKIYVGEIRNVYTSMGVSKENRNEGSIVRAVREATGRDQMVSENSLPGIRIPDFFYQAFECYDCEFDFSESMGFDSSDSKHTSFLAPSSGGSAMQRIQFNINVGRIEESHQFGGMKYSEGTMSKFRKSEDIINAEVDRYNRLSQTESYLGKSANLVKPNRFSLGNLANSLGPFSGAAKGALMDAERFLGNLEQAPDRFLNGAMSEIRRVFDGGSLGNLGR